MSEIDKLAQALRDLIEIAEVVACSRNTSIMDEQIADADKALAEYESARAQPASVGDARHFDLIEQLCRDLNQAHDELMRAQGAGGRADKLDWPEWTPQANSIRAAERLLGKKLAKTNAWSEFRDAAPQPPSAMAQDAPLCMSCGKRKEKCDGC